MNFLTCQPADLREPQTALRYAKMSQAKAVGTDSDRLNILGQANFATGDVVSAIESEEKALRLLAPPPSNQIDSPTRRRIKTQLAKFKSSLRHK
jgi:hypothetical protein